MSIKLIFLARGTSHMFQALTKYISVVKRQERKSLNVEKKGRKRKEGGGENIANFVI